MGSRETRTRGIVDPSSSLMGGLAVVAHGMQFAVASDFSPRFNYVLLLCYESVLGHLAEDHSPKHVHVLCLHSQTMNFSVFEHFPLTDGTIFGLGGRRLPPRGRAHTFAAAFRHFEKTGGKVVVELGTTRSFVDGAYEGCNAGCFDGGCTPEEVERWWRPDDPSFWDWGAGTFGRLAALCLGHLAEDQHQVDYAEAHILRAQAMNSDMPHVMYHHSMSEDFLENFQGKIDLLYLDTGDVRCMCTLCPLRVLCHQTSYLKQHYFF